jgi:hypothetical protein
MKKAAVKTTNLEDVEQNLAAFNAKSQFWGATLNMGWRLAITVVIPLVAGVKLDEKFDSSPLYTLLGMVIAAAAGSAAVWATVKEVNEEIAATAVPKKVARKSKENN